MASFEEPAVFISAPCANCATYVRSCPGFGRLLIVFASSVVDVFAFSRLISPDCAITSTDCEVAAGDNVKFTVTVWPTATLVGCDLPDRIPRWTSIRYVPGFTWENRKRPSPSLLTLADRARIHLGRLHLRPDHRPARVGNRARKRAAGAALRPRRA